MLRAKHIGTLSQSARSFFLSGSRCSAGDGSSCTCTSEDESCISRNHHTRNGFALAQASSRVAGSLITGDPSKLAHANKTESVKNLISGPQVIPIVGPPRPDNEVADSSSPIAAQLLLVGMRTAEFISGGVGSMIDGNRMLSSARHHVVERVKPVSSIKSSNVKTYTDEKVQKKPSEENRGSGSVPTNYSTSAKNRSEKSNSVRGFYVPKSDVAGNFQEGCDISSNYGVKKGYAVNKPKGKGEIIEGFSNFSKDTKVPNRVTAPVTRQFSNNTHVVEAFSRILQQLRWGPATEEALKKLSFSVDAYQANQILKQLQDYSVALGFFQWLKRQPGFKHDGHTYTTMIGILGRSRQFGTINKLLDQMAFDGCKPNVVTFNRLIHSYGRANYLKEAVNVFHQMQKAGCDPDRVTYCTLIDIHAKAGYLDFAMHLYGRMQEVGLSPDAFTYSVIINCLGKGGHLNDAQKLFSEMVSHGCEPTLVTYNIMIALHAKARNYSTALELYHKMQEAGFEPDNVTYSIVMEVLGHCGYLEEAEAVYLEMKRKNWVPDEPVYGLLVDLWGKSGNVEKALRWYQAMLHEGLRPNVPTCNSLLSAFLRVHRLSDAYSLLQGMLNLGLCPSLQTYTLLLSCCTEAQTNFDMGFCCELMAVTGHPAHTFLMSMPASGPDGQNVREHMCTFLNLMHSEDRESKRGLVDAVIDFLHKTGLKEEAGSVWEVAADKNVYPDALTRKSPCYWLINLHVMSDGTAVTALSRTLAWFRREMLVSGFCPSRIDIVTGWGRRSRVTGASLVKEAVENLLSSFSFPFFTENGNTGCFVGYGEPLSRWLGQGYVERMHLL